MSNIQKCKSCRGNLFTPSQPCVTQQCIQNTKCSEIIDAACIAYSGQDLLLCQEYKLISQNDNVEVALQNLFASACENCAMSVEITPVEGSYPSLTAAVTNGTGPYTYNWSIAQGPFVGHDVLGSTNLNTLDLEGIGANSILANYPTTCDYVVLTNFNVTVTTYQYRNCDDELITLTLDPNETIPSPICVKQWITPLGPNDAIDKFLNLKNNRALGTPNVTYTYTACDGGTYPFTLPAQASVDLCVRKWVSTLTAQDVITYAPTICDQREVIKSTVVRLDVTDSKGCKKSVYYDFSCDCYVQTQEPEGQYTEYLGGNLQFWDFPSSDINFLDRDDTTITCSELKSFGCLVTEDFVNDYRDLRVDFYIGTTCIVVAEQDSSDPEQVCASNLPLDYTTWDPNGYADQTIVNKGRLTTVNIDFGCPEYTFWTWSNVQFLSLNGDRIVDRLPTVKDHMVKLPDVTLISQIPTTGKPGEYLECDQDGNFYAWDPTLNQFSSVLGMAIETTILIFKRARRDAQLKAFNELVIAQQAFLLAADTLPLHRYKYELI